MPVVALTLGLSALTVLGSVTACLAQDTPTVASNAEAIQNHKVIVDTIWTLLAGVLVFFMQAGFALV